MWEDISLMGSKCFFCFLYGHMVFIQIITHAPKVQNNNINGNCPGPFCSTKNVDIRWLLTMKLQLYLNCQWHYTSQGLHMYKGATQVPLGLTEIFISHYKSKITCICRYTYTIQCMYLKVKIIIRRSPCNWLCFTDFLLVHL